ncbi:unnamed protein product [Symbiodinium natans]|uniref:Uncharacterized protein n=1 Tax=Symbiodinium natans TaxID=878477 RepID=A0A812MEZ2_9DINO|nr:unnamed protein product [Symbiodinium natans]
MAFSPESLPLAGQMILHNGAAYLRLEPASPTPAAPAPPAAAPEEPVAACAVRPVPDMDVDKPPTHADIQRNIDSGAILVHASRVAQTASAHRSLVTNIQKAPHLSVGISNGEWGVEAQRRLFELLRKAKRSRGRVLAIADKEEGHDDDQASMKLRKSKRSHAPVLAITDKEKGHDKILEPIEDFQDQANDPDPVENFDESGKRELPSSSKDDKDKCPDDMDKSKSTKADDKMSRRDPSNNSSSSSSSDSSTSENRKSNKKHKTEMVPLEDFERVSVAYDEAIAENNEFRQDIYAKDLRISELEDGLLAAQQQLEAYEREV